MGNFKIGTKVIVTGEFKVFNTKTNGYVENPNREGSIIKMFNNDRALVLIEPIGDHWYDINILKEVNHI
jgi:hypothetical protein